MKKESEFQRNIDIGKIFESTLLGVFVLLGNYFNSIYLFFRHPREFAGVLDEESREKTTSSYRIVRPLTFLVMSLAILILVTIALNEGAVQVIKDMEAVMGIHIKPPPKEASLSSSMRALFHDGLKEFDPKKLILAVLPYALAIGLFSYMITRVARKSGLEFSFTKSMGLSSFFVGSAIDGHIIATALISLVYYYSNAPLIYLDFWLYAVSFWFLFVVILSFRLFYSYLAVLKTELDISWKRSLVVWLGGVWRFVLCVFVIVLFTAPLMTAFNLQSHLGYKS